MKTVVNVYKHLGSWKKRPPGIGDYLRGCAYLLHASREGAFAGQFQPRMNLDLAPGAEFLERSALHLPAGREELAAAAEFFDPARDGEVSEHIRRFLAEDGDTLYVSTNASWRGVDDPPAPDILNELSQLLCTTPAFDERFEARFAALARGYILIHVRDEDRSGPNAPGTPDEEDFRSRARIFVERIRRAHPADRIVIVSNNVPLRKFLSRAYGLIDARTEVGNPGFSGSLTEGELMDAALIARCRQLHALTYFPWNSGFSVWVSRLHGVPAEFSNAHTVF